MSYIGSTPVTQSFIAGTDYFNGNGSTTAFTLSRNVVSVNDIQATVNNVVQQPNDAYNVSGNTITFTSAPSSGTGNVYVRYMSTTTQSITPSQNTVSYSTLNTDLQSGGYASNLKNRIINGAMVIDQRNAGASVTNIDGQVFATDRFQCWGSVASKYTAQQSSTAPAGFTKSLLITSSSAYSVGSTDYFMIQQRVEGFNTADLAWGTADAQSVTLSFKVRSSLTGTFGGSLKNLGNNRSYPFTYTISSANTFETKTITIAGETSGSWNTTNDVGIQVTFGLGVGSTYSGTAGAWASSNFLSATGAVSVVGTNGATFYITGVQLEKGSTATSFDYRPYGTELNLCQRYFQIVGGSSTEHWAMGVMSTNRINTIYGFKQTMRASPSFSATSFGSSFSDLTIYAGAATYTATGTNENYSSPNNISIGFTHAGASTSGAAGYVYFNSTNARVAFSAEL
jgi:hypothetical protein